jgi:hypothetical protein
MIKIFLKHAPKAHTYEDGFNTVIDIKDSNGNEIRGGTLLQRAYLVGDETRVILIPFTDPKEIAHHEEISAYIMEDCIYIVTTYDDYKCKLEYQEMITEIADSVIDLR